MKSYVCLAAGFCLLALSFVPLNGAPGKSEDVAQVRAAIEAANLKFGEAVRKGDAAAIAALYSEDATVLPPDSDMIQGRQRIEASWKGSLQMGIKDAVLTTVNVSGAGDYAYEVGKVLLTIQPPGQAAMQQTAKYVVVWKKAASGTWQLHVDIWNSLPAK
ncbi:MAG: Ketosteroid isomerase [Candidatus Aminicenantes bacterium]|nr:Ketosteroid isomerase [Candidatus Aminicenantes bacterium]